MHQKTAVFMTDQGLLHEVLGVKTKQSHPYGYDPIVQFQTEPADSDEPVISQWSDHLVSRHEAQYNRLCREFFGNEGHYWDQRQPEATEAFLRKLLKQPKLHLVRITEHCSANGFPVWQFHFQLFNDEKL